MSLIRALKAYVQQPVPEEQASPRDQDEIGQWFVQPTLPTLRTRSILGASGPTLSGLRDPHAERDVAEKLSNLLEDYQQRKASGTQASSSGAIPSFYVPVSACHWVSITASSGLIFDVYL